MAGFDRFRARGGSTPAADESDDKSSPDAWLAAANDPQTKRVLDFRYDDPPTVYLGMSNTESFSPPAIKVAPETTVKPSDLFFVEQ